MSKLVKHEQQRIKWTTCVTALQALLVLTNSIIFKGTNIIAHFAYLSLIDEASKYMSATHIISSPFSIENNGTGQPDIYHIIPLSTGARADFIGGMYSAFNHQFTQPLSDMRRSFPTFTRNIAISTGSNSEDYEDLYALEPGKLLFSQNSFTKLRRVYAAKRISDHTLYRTKERLNFLFPIVIKNREYHVFYGAEFDMAQGGYKDEFYDKLPTGIIGILQSGALAFGQKHYDNHMCFLQLVSALGIDRNIWELGNLKYDLKEEGLMYNSFQNLLNDIKSDFYGYPNLAQPTSHFNITPFEAIYADLQTYEHIKLVTSIEENSGYTTAFLDSTTKFITNEIEANDLYLQNKIIGDNHNQWLTGYTYKAWYKAQKTVTIGRKVTPKTDEGDFTIKASGDITAFAGESISLKPNFHTKAGSTFHAYIYYDADCNYSGITTHNSETNQEVIKQNSLSEESQRVSSFEKIANNDDLQVFPNPSEGNITIVFPNDAFGNYEIVNTLGIAIEKGEIPIGKKASLKLDKGVYIIKSSTKTKKILIL